MSSPRFSFSPRRSRGSSFASQNARDDPQDGVHRATPNPPPHGSALSPSVASPHREPIRSFIHSSVREYLAPIDSASFARSVREDTAELASYYLSDHHDQSHALVPRQTSASASGPTETATPSHETETIVEASEPESVENGGTMLDSQESYESLSLLTNLLKRSPPQSQLPSPPDVQISADDLSNAPSASVRSREREPPSSRDHHEPDETLEQTPLLPSARTGGLSYGSAPGRATSGDMESQKPVLQSRWYTSVVGAPVTCVSKAARKVHVAFNPKSWDRKTVWENCVIAPISCLPAVIVGLLLNILDALSYGMILFPLGDPLFSHLGSAGISIFYVSTIVSQLTFSSASIFKGGIGSELIEVVPFFHSMASTITGLVGRDNPDAVIATTITSYALSSMLTGLVFYSMGKFRFGYMVGFIPRHILIGCIGGVGWFLIATGFEVTARLESFHYDLDTAKRLIQTDTLPLWLVPLGLSIALFYGQFKIKSKYFLPLFILIIPVLFYIIITPIRSLNPEMLREHGWIFEGPPAGEPWWYFWTLYKFNLVRWDAIVECVPAMFALTFFGILHVPINVPALALQTGEDHADLDHELKLHGCSNFFSGLAGSIQNYLVYANTVFFMRSGGDSRLAGFELTLLTFLVMVIGPSMVGFIPIMMVGTLIFDLGFELLLEAIWSPRKKLKPLEYLTVIVIVLVMGIYDFVIGIFVGILLAFATLVVQTSRVPAIRGTLSGDVVGSTVRRNPSQYHFLKHVGRQIYIVQLSGFLFFGTIVSVEQRIRHLISEDTFANSPIKFLVLDLWHVTGLDYSAGEAFNTISRLLKNKGILLTISGVDADGGLGRDLRAIGLGEDDAEIPILPNLNSALESCENELLKTFYVSQEEARNAAPAKNLDVPHQAPSQANHLSVPDNSPRTNQLAVAAQNTIDQLEIRKQSKWQNFAEPLRLMLQIFQDISGKNEDFWFSAVPFFERQHYGQGTVLFKTGEKADGFWLLEKGILRAEYDLPQGGFSELIVAGTTCGELPFFSNTERTATVIAERDCITWMLTTERWNEMIQKEPEIARVLLTVCLKLTAERMHRITGYTLAIAG